MAIYIKGQASSRSQATKAAALLILNDRKKMLQLIRLLSKLIERVINVRQNGKWNLNEAMKNWAFGRLVKSKSYILTLGLICLIFGLRFLLKKEVKAFNWIDRRGSGSVTGTDMAMVSSRLLLFLSSISMLVTLASAQPPFIYHVCSNVQGNYTKKSTYEANLNHALSSITSNTDDDNGFYSGTSDGQNPDKVFAIGLCRGDLKKDVCLRCLNDSTVALTQLCPNQKEAIGWYDNCSLRFSNTPILCIERENPNFIVWNSKNESDVDGYGEALKTLLDTKISEAASGASRKFATGTSVAPDFSKIHVLLQCTPDLTEQECSNCLQIISRKIPLCCVGQAGARYYTPSCNFRYESYPFFDLTAAPWSPVKGKGTNNRTAIIIVVPIVFLMLLILSICIYLRMRKPKDNFETVDEITSVESVQFDLGTIRAATDNFSDANKLGKGGFGTVFRGKLSNGQEIAVKRLSRNSGQGDVEFKNEVLLVAKLQHRNLVRLLGFCLEGNERLLIYEFVPNTSLDYYIFDPMKRADLDWERRYKIIGGIARGLLYLHEDSRLRIIHRDLKTGNILLDANMNPKISDFGMARLFVLDQTEGSTNRIVGTYGYMAPEYAMFGQFSTKSDVFSFGILILEIISGQKITNFRDVENMEYLLSYAWRNWSEGTTSNLIDPTLIKSGPITEMMRYIHIGLLCVQQNIADRPEMASIVLMLNSDSVALPVPKQPATFLQSNVQSATSLQLDINCGGITDCEVSISELYPR